MKPLRIAILHYHLRGGGVTRIIEHTFEAYENKPVKLCVIIGEEPPEKRSVPEDQTGVVRGLSYGNQNPDKEPDELTLQVKEKAKELLGGEPDLWHVHNHSLGKNEAFTKMVLRLAEEGKKMLLHLHDFAEDNRPENYKYLFKEKGFDKKPLTTQLYPQADHVHYAVLNGRDFNLLKETGFDVKHLHLLSNPVKLSLNHSENADSSDYGISGKVFLYPCRVIPRKNIGEYILWAAMSEGEEHFAVTLAPKNERYKEGYQRWKNLVEELGLPVVFEAGDQWDMSYPDLLDRADVLVSTSIAEGFGLIYLESWLTERPLAGRILPDITTDFKDKGIEFSGMYEVLKILVSWIGREDLEKRLTEAISQIFNKYGMKLSEKEESEWVKELTKDDKVDFGILNQELQIKAIKKLTENPSLKDQLRQSGLANGLANSSTIQQNKEIVEKEFSLEKYGSRLYLIFEEIIESSAEDLRFIKSDELLQKFISPENFSLLRS